MLAFQEAALRRQLSGFGHWSDEQMDEFVRMVTSDAWRAQLFGDQLPQAASLIASMHWALLEFRDEVLATSDQPVTVVPLLGEQDWAPLATLPPGGLASCEEIRMALDPRHALLMTWLNEPDDGPMFHGTDRVAAELNRAVIGQADEQWFHHPARRPTTLTPGTTPEQGCGAIGRLLFRDYDHESALCSQRRLDTLENLESMIEGQISGDLRVAGVSVSSTGA
jgi:hypothetical protein